MATPAASLRPQLRYDPVQLLGAVIRYEGKERWRVRCDGKDWLVARAASCLLLPAVGDEVLMAGPIPERVYLIAVIRQADPTAAHLALQGDVHIASTQGRISMKAAEGLDFSAGAGIGMSSESFDLSSKRAKLTIDDLDYLGRQASFAVTKASWVGAACDVVVDRISQVADSVLRLVRKSDQIRAGRLDYEAEESVRLHGGHTLLTAKNLVKVDADQIHMG